MRFSKICVIAATTLVLAACWDIERPSEQDVTVTATMVIDTNCVGPNSSNDGSVCTVTFDVCPCVKRDLFDSVDYGSSIQIQAHTTHPSYFVPLADRRPHPRE